MIVTRLMWYFPIQTYILVIKAFIAIDIDPKYIATIVIDLQNRRESHQILLFGTKLTIHLLALMVLLHEIKIIMAIIYLRHIYPLYFIISFLHYFIYAFNKFIII